MNDVRAHERPNQTKPHEKKVIQPQQTLPPGSNAIRLAQRHSIQHTEIDHKQINILISRFENVAELHPITYQVVSGPCLFPLSLPRTPRLQAAVASSGRQSSTARRKAHAGGVGTRSSEAIEILNQHKANRIPRPTRVVQQFY